MSRALGYKSAGYGAAGSRAHRSGLRRIGLIAALLLLLISAIAPMTARAACTSGACVMAGPRLVSLNTTQGALTNALLGGLLGTNVNLSVLDWNNIAGGNVSALSMINAAQAKLGVSTPAQALSTQATIAQLISAAAGAAQADGYTASATALNALTVPIGGLTGTIALGDLLNAQFPTGSLTNTKINALDLVTGLVQLYNYKNVATTPSPITISGSALGLGASITSVQLYAQVVEPPVYVCGPVNSQFYSAAIRVKLNLTLVSLTPNGSSLNVLGLANASVTIGSLQLYVDVARAAGTISSVDAIAGAVSVQVTPGVANIYLGQIADNVFFLRGRAIDPNADISYADIGNLTISVLGLPVTVSIQAWSYGLGIAPFQQVLNFTGPYPQRQSASTSAVFANNLVTGLVTNLHVKLNPLLGGLLDAGILTPLKALVGTTISPVLTTVLSGLVDPLLELVGIKLGEVEVTVSGVALICTVAGNVYSDGNHNATMDGFESGTGVTLYAKLVALSSPTTALQAVAVNTSTGTYTFSSVWPANYSVLVSTNNNTADVTAIAPSGWIATETPTLTRNDIQLVNVDVVAKNFGLFNGSRISGTVFSDIGTTGGTANNGVKDGAEAGVAGATIRLQNGSGASTYDTTTSAGDGTYAVWIAAATAGNVALRVVETNLANMMSTGGSAGTTSGAYTRATDITAFTNVIGTSFTGVNFADVPDNTWAASGRKNALPGASVFYAHTFTAGTAGQLTVAVDASVNSDAALWTDIVYLDANCNGTVDAGEVLLASPLATTAGQKVCVVVKTAVPSGIDLNRQHQVTLTASYSYTNASPALSGSLALTDLTTVSEQSDPALRLSKVVDKASAKSGDAITYTITYSNQGTEGLVSLKINDTTPAYTNFSTAACGTLPTGMTGCSLTKQPTAGTAGAVEWSLTGTLSPGASGSVTMVVTLQ